MKKELKQFFVVVMLLLLSAGHAESASRRLLQDAVDSESTESQRTEENKEKNEAEVESPPVLRENNQRGRQVDEQENKQDQNQPAKRRRNGPVVQQQKQNEGRENIFGSFLSRENPVLQDEDDGVLDGLTEQASVFPEETSDSSASLYLEEDAEVENSTEKTTETVLEGDEQQTVNVVNLQTCRDEQDCNRAINTFFRRCSGSYDSDCCAALRELNTGLLSSCCWQRLCSETDAFGGDVYLPQCFNRTC